MKTKLLLISFLISKTIIAQIIAAGNTHSLIVCNDSTAMTWGYNFYGQLGNGTTLNSNVPVQVGILSGIMAIAGGANHSLALKNDSTVWAWGNNQWGQLGNGTNNDSNTPVQVNGLSQIVAIAAGSAGHSIAVKNDGTVWTWGYNFFGQLGNGTNSDSNIPVQVSSLNGIISVSGGSTASYALKNDGTVWAWGNNPFGQLGSGNNNNSNIPVQVSGLTGIIAIIPMLNENKEKVTIGW